MQFKFPKLNVLNRTLFLVALLLAILTLVFIISQRSIYEIPWYLQHYCRSHYVEYDTSPGLSGSLQPIDPQNQYRDCILQKGFHAPVPVGGDVSY